MASKRLAVISNLHVGQPLPAGAPVRMAGSVSSTPNAIGAKCSAPAVIQFLLSLKLNATGESQQLLQSVPVYLRQEASGVVSLELDLLALHFGRSRYFRLPLASLQSRVCT